jgi:hypothetical protein
MHKNITNVGKEFKDHPYNEMAVVESKHPPAPIKKVKSKKRKDKGSRSPNQDFINIGPQMMMDQAINGRISPTATNYREY